MERYGFNFQWMFSSWNDHTPADVDQRALDFLAAMDFNFVRIPCDYLLWTTDFDYLHPNEAIFEKLDQYIAACRQRKMQMSLNLHRAPGYCINKNDREKHNLWLDREAQEGFCFLWEYFATRYKGVPNDVLSFDLVNEPPNVGEYGMTRENHAAIIRRAVDAIRAVDPEREIAIDGLGGGNRAMPELADLAVIHSGRGYQPMAVSHYEATWWKDHAGLPEPIYPGTEWDGTTWNKEILRAFYQPWRDVQRAGVRIHIGEFGCFNHTPNDVALRWLADLLALFQEFGWGYSLWNFAGPFGIIDHGRAGAKFEKYRGYNVDRALLDLLLEYRS